MTQEKRADLAGPGIDTYEHIEQLLPDNYESVLEPRETQEALFAARRYLEDHLCQSLGLMMVSVPLIVERDSGVNDMLDRDGSRTPVDFQCGLGLEEPLHAQVVQAATKWKRMALKQFSLAPGEGICTDMRGIRKDYFLDHDHSAYVDQWDWEKVITAEQRSLDTLLDAVQRIWKVIKGAEAHLHQRFPSLTQTSHPLLPESLTMIHAEDLLARYPDLPRKERETRLLQEHPAVFIIGIGWPLEDGLPHELRAADYDDWSTPTCSSDGRPMHGINGDILVWNPVTQRRHELTSMGVRVDAEALRLQMKLAGLEDDLALPYHQAILRDEVPLSIGGGIGQSRTLMLLLQKAHIGEVSVSVWPQALKESCARKNIPLLT